MEKTAGEETLAGAAPALPLPHLHVPKATGTGFRDT